ncbi:MAG TPA: hypothetical protein VF439_04010 [Candidatus Paceibacterota bacterium]
MSIVTIFHPANVKRGGEKVKLVAIFPPGARGVITSNLLKGLNATFCNNIRLEDGAMMQLTWETDVSDYEDGARKAVRFGTELKEALPYEPLYSPS